METAVDNNDLRIPLIDFSQCLSSDISVKLSAARAVTNGFKTAGFIYLKNHSIRLEDCDRLFKISAEFFNRTQEQKDLLKWGMQGGSSSPGYTAYGGEKLSQSLKKEEIDELRACNPDMKEAFDVGLERIQGGASNIWPGETDEFMTNMKLIMQAFFEECRKVQVTVMRAIALGLGLEETFFDKLIDDADNTIRCLHYPPVHSRVFRENNSSVRAGAHSDYGSITLLFQDSQGGLQVSSPDGTFIDAVPIPGTIVVNAGDLLSRWSNDTIKSTVHRVIQPPLSRDSSHDEILPSRYSIAYFCNPNLEMVIDALPGTWEATVGKKYEAVTSRQWLMKRLTLAHDKETDSLTEQMVV